MNRMFLYSFGFLTSTISYVIGGNWSRHQPHSTDQPPYIMVNSSTPMYCNPPYQERYTFPNNVVSYANPQYLSSVYCSSGLMPITTTRYACSSNTMSQYSSFSRVHPSQYTNVLPQQPYRVTTNSIPYNHYSYNGNHLYNDYFVYRPSAQYFESRKNNQEVFQFSLDNVSDSNPICADYEEDLLTNHKKWLEGLNPERRNVWKALETRIIEMMVERIKRKRIVPYNKNRDRYLFMDYTYTGDDVSFMKEITRWEVCDRIDIKCMRLTLAEIHVVLIKIGNSTEKLDRIKEILFLRYIWFRKNTHLYFDHMYSLCVLRYNGFNMEWFGLNFRENNLESISNEQQFMTLFNMILAIAFEHPRPYTCLCLDNLLASLTFNRRFVLSSKTALLIAKNVLGLNNFKFTYLIFSDCIQVAITIEDSIELLKYVKNNNSDNWKFYIRLYFFLTFKFKENKLYAGSISKIHRLQEAFVKTYGAFFPNAPIPTEEELASNKCTEQWISKVTDILGTDYMGSEKGKEVSKMLFTMATHSQDGCIENQEKGYFRPWMYSYSTDLSEENSINYLISKLGKENFTIAKLANFLFWQLNCIVFQPDYNENAFKRLFKVVLEGGNVVHQMLVLLTGAEFLKDEKVQSEIVEMFKNGKHPGCIYLPYIGDILQIKYPPANPWSVSKFVEEVVNLTSINSYRRILYHILRMFTYENKQFHDNFLEYSTSIMKIKIKKSKKCIAKDIFCTLAKNKYYSNVLNDNLENIVKYMKRNGPCEDSSKTEKLVSSILNNGNPFFQDSECLFNMLIQLYE
ncbi:hypothetical protein PAEPH01_1455 [Pancytospora epiphaga]|nr:hypothetical protein PAEPH01_1455 [Pancytospora epiphaga]